MPLMMVGTRSGSTVASGVDVIITGGFDVEEIAASAFATPPLGMMRWGLVFSLAVWRTNIETVPNEIVSEMRRVN